MFEKVGGMQIVTTEELRQKEAALTAKIKGLLPDFVRARRENEDVMIVHQDSFAADYQDDEYALLGMAIKFAGPYGKEVRIIGTNRETLKEPRKTELLQYKQDRTVGTSPAENPRELIFTGFADCPTRCGNGRLQHAKTQPS